jgi:hypothetical protein
MLGKFKLLALIYHIAMDAWNAEQAAEKQPGSSKLQDVLAGAQAALTDIFGDIFPATAQGTITTALTALINAIVAIANTLGIFRHTTPTS